MYDMIILAEECMYREPALYLCYVLSYASSIMYEAKKKGCGTLYSLPTNMYNAMDIYKTQFAYGCKLYCTAR
jgi:hypothetical protein